MNKTDQFMSEKPFSVLDARGAEFLYRHLWSGVQKVSPYNPDLEVKLEVWPAPTQERFPSEYGTAVYLSVPEETYTFAVSNEANEVILVIIHLKI